MAIDHKTHTDPIRAAHDHLWTLIEVYARALEVEAEAQAEAAPYGQTGGTDLMVRARDVRDARDGLGAIIDQIVGDA